MVVPLVAAVVIGSSPWRPGPGPGPRPLLLSPPFAFTAACASCTSFALVAAVLVPRSALFADPLPLGLARLVLGALLGFAARLFEDGSVRIGRGRGRDRRRRGDRWLARSRGKATARGGTGRRCQGLSIPERERARLHVGLQCLGKSILLCFFDAFELFLPFALAGFGVGASLLVVPGQVLAVLPPSDGCAQTMAEVVFTVLVL